MCESRVNAPDAGQRGETTRILLDCDTGIDDALAILYLAGLEGVSIVAAGSVHGNVPAPLGALNTLRVLELAGLDDVPVAVGAARPMAQPLQTAEFVHGEDGLGNIHWPMPRRRPSAEPAAQQIVRLAREQPGELVLLAIGPLTNLGLALLLEPELPRLLRRVVVMGGAVYRAGNATADAEANVWHDPEAAELALGAGWPLTLVGLDVTMQVSLAGDALAELQAASSAVGRFAWSILQHYLAFYESYYGARMCHLHDPLAAGIAVDSSLARYRRTPVHVELRGERTRGATRGSLPWWLNPPSGEPEVEVAVEVDAERFVRGFLDVLAGARAP
ncbi:MAG: nucleoside hydrolase [Chloroflexi bacterium]|nr:nucleoside hydrolase [Chloroflexota bacterium]